MNYQCYYCDEIFPGSEAIDGYKKGYKIGFLCPRCGKNIQDPLTNQEWIYPNHTFQLFYAVLVMYAIIATAVLNILDSNSWTPYLIAAGGLMLLLIYGHLRHPDAMDSPTLRTKPVNK